MALYAELFRVTGTKCFREQIFLEVTSWGWADGLSKVFLEPKGREREREKQPDMVAYTGRRFLELTDQSAINSKPQVPVSDCVLKEKMNSS